MNRRFFLVCAAAFTLSVPAAAQASKPGIAPADASPEAIVRNLYDRHAAAVWDYMTDRTARRRYFTAETAGMVERTYAKADRRDELGIEYEPLIDGLDGEVKDLRVTLAASDAANAVVEASFRSYGEAVSVLFRFRKDRSSWRIHDIEGRDGFTLRKIMEEYLKG